MSAVWGLLGVLLLASAARGFGILPGNSRSHQEITEEAIFNVTVQVCRALAQAEGNDFALPSQPFSASGVAGACRAPGSVKSFQRAISSITLRNVRVDLLEALNASFHFDDETFVSGRDIVAAGLQMVKANNKQRNFEAAQDSLGEALHTLQDFYSHSNWAENGNTLPNSNLIRPNASIGNIADESRATCRSCDGDDCSNNILEDVAREQILTTGYFAVIPGTASKPSGKCSHGGALDLTSRIEPTGGINKDTLESEHGFLHAAAADLATMATSEVLENVRQAAGDRPFLQMLGISRGSGRALCFVIDTTQSMSDDIGAVQSAAAALIDSQVGGDDEPLSYILVPFNDPAFGPPIRTGDPEAFEDILDDLTAGGGGDDEEPSLSALQLALTNAPQSSDIFVFTDAPAKDAQLKSTVIALIERTQSAVYFLITQTTANSRRRRRRQALARIGPPDAALYRDVAEAAGGLAVELRQEQLQEAVAVVGQLASSSLVTLVRGSGTPPDDGDFAFAVDRTVSDLRLLLTGPASRVAVIDPQGRERVFNTTSLRPLGNLQTLQLEPQAGRWRVAVEAAQPYTLRAVGRSAIDFLFDFVEFVPSQNAFDVLDTRPSAGANGSLLVTLTDGDAADVTRVVLAEVAGTLEVAGAVEPLGRGRYLVRVPRVPSAPFVVRVEGDVRDAGGGGGQASPLQRETATSWRASNISIKAEAARNLVPGTPLAVGFSVTVAGGARNVSIRASTNNPLYTAEAPSSLLAAPSANGTVTLSVPLNTPSGATVALVIEAEDPGAADVNYVVLRISVLNPVTDFAAPVCEALCLVRCVRNSSAAPWHLLVSVSDGAEGTGVERVSLARGDGTLYVRPAPDDRNVTLVTYDALCQSPRVELLVVDNVGNADTCSFDAFAGSRAGRAAFFLAGAPLGWAALALAVLQGFNAG